MTLQTILKSQYRASLTMLLEAIRGFYPAGLAPGTGAGKIRWRWTPAGQEDAPPIAASRRFP